MATLGKGWKQKHPQLYAAASAATHTGLSKAKIKEVVDAFVSRFGTNAIREIEEDRVVEATEFFKGLAE